MSDPHVQFASDGRDEDGLGAAFGDPVHDAQAVFRAILRAVSEPGTPVPLPDLHLADSPFSKSIAAVLLTLADYDTPIWLAGAFDRLVAWRYLAFHTGATRASKEGAAAFVAGAWDEVPSLEHLAQGTSQYPDRSATLILPVGDMTSGEAARLSGPGLERPRQFAPGGLGADFWIAAAANHARFPLGIDILLCGTDEIAALPRSTAVEPL